MQCFGQSHVKLLIELNSYNKGYLNKEGTVIVAALLGCLGCFLLYSVLHYTALQFPGSLFFLAYVSICVLLAYI